MTRLAALPHRAVIAVAGEDRVAFLQGLVSNDVALAVPGRAIWSALLTPQGKWLADFFIIADGDRLLLDCERDQAGMLVQKLSRFRLRSKVTLAQADDLHVHAAWEGEPQVDAIVAADTRLPEAGWRVLAAAALPVAASAADYDLHRLRLGLPDGTRDMEPEKSVLLEAGFDELSGISWTKGCYMGQELTARTRYRGLVKRRLYPVAIQGALPAAGTPVLSGGAEVGTMRSGRDGLGLALLRLGAAESDRLECGGAVLIPAVPGWMRLPEET